MKKTCISLMVCVCMMISMQNMQAQIKVVNGGNVGIGMDAATTPGYKLDVNGTVNLRSTLDVRGKTSLNSGLYVFGTTEFAFSGHILTPNKGFKAYIEIISGGGTLVNFVPFLISENNYGGIIGTSTYPMREVRSTSFYGTLYATSDMRMKSNIKKVDNINKEKLNKLSVYTYDMKESFYDSIKAEGVREVMKKGAKARLV